MEPNVLLIVCDTLRQDALSLYGGKAHTPAINMLAKDGMVYENAIAPSPWTFPSHVSLFTGLYASEHGVHETKTEKLLALTKFQNALTVERTPDMLDRKGYNTLGISNNPMVSTTTGFDKGFQFFFTVDPFPLSKEDKNFVEARKLGASPSKIALKLLQKAEFGKLMSFAGTWMKKNAVEKALNFPMDKGASLTNKLLADSKWESKFFKFVNFLEVHEPYRNYNSKEVWDNVTGIKKMNSSSIKSIKEQYVKETEYLDGAIGNLISTLKRFDYYDDTMIIVTSDHGQAFNEHGYMLHSTYLYDELVRIPMIIKYPNSKKFKARKGYQNLVNVDKLIKNVVEGGDDSPLTTESTFSEAFGAVILLPGGYEHRKEYVDRTYEKVRKAVYKDDYKMTINGTEGTIEEFMKGKKEIKVEEDLEKAKELINEIDIFKGKEAFKLPNI